MISPPLRQGTLGGRQKKELSGNDSVTREFFDYSVETFKENGWILEDVNYDYPLTNNENDVPTEYERKFRKLGQPIHYLRAVKGEQHA